MSNRKEFEAAVLSHVQKHGISGTPWICFGVAARINGLINVLISELTDEDRLTKTLRVVRVALKSIYEDVNHAEMSCFMNCGCVNGGECLPWSSWTAGCPFRSGAGRVGVGGELYDVGRLLEINHGGGKAQQTALLAIEALKTIVGELRDKEEWLLDAMERFEKTQQKENYENQMDISPAH